MKKHEKKRMKVCFLGHFDSTNFGNESTLQAILYHLHSYQPDVEVACISTGPEAVAEAYQIEPIPISENLLAKSWLPQNRWLRLVRRVFIGIPSEPCRWVKGIVRLRRVNILIIPGTGLLSDASGLTGWGPYNLFKWSLIAKICRCKLFFVSVGAGPIYTTMGKLFIKSALFLADFRSYRDKSTMQYLKGIGFHAENDRVYPDLAFSLPATVVTYQHAKRNDREVVGLGLMAYAERDSTPRPSNMVYPAYLENLASVAKWLLSQENDVRLLIGDLGDVRTIREFKGLLRKQFPMFDRGHIIHEPILSVKDLLSQIAATDIIVATRFHNVLLALLSEKPVISISFHHKCKSLMSSMGLSSYCLNINGLKADELIEKISDLRINAARLKPLIREKNKEFRKALDEQYRVIFNAMWPRSNSR